MELILGALEEDAALSAFGCSAKSEWAREEAKLNKMPSLYLDVTGGTNAWVVVEQIPWINANRVGGIRWKRLMLNVMFVDCLVVFIVS